MNALPMQVNRTACPHCGASCRTIKSAQISQTYREITYLCTNTACACLFVAAVTPVRIIDQSATPNPDIHLPVMSGRGAD